MAIDLHGHSVKEAKAKVIKTFSDAKDKNVTNLTVVTGIGNHVNANGTRGVLFKALPKWLKSIPELKERVHEVKQDKGGYEIVFKSDTSLQDHINAISNEMKLLLEKTDSTKLLKSYEKKAKEGDFESLALLGSMFLNGIVFKKDIDKGLEYLESAAKKSDIVKNQLGHIYASIEFARHDYGISRKWFKAAADNKHADSLFELGKMYWLGQGVIKSDKKAYDLLKEAADLGNKSAAFNLAEILFYGCDSINEDRKLAAHYYLIAAKAEMVTAQLMLAKQYFFGLGIDQDDSQAFHWFERSAKHDEPVAAYYVGLCYETGRHVSPDKVKAYLWYRKSAKLGDPDARFNIAYAKLNGIVFPKNIPEALQEFTKLATENHNNSLYVLGEFLLKPGEYHDFDSAMDKLIRAGKLNQVSAKELVIQRYLSGEPITNEKVILEWLSVPVASVDIDNLYFWLITTKIKTDTIKNLADTWLKELTKRANENCKEAETALGQLLHQGCIGLTKNLKKSFEYLERAAMKKHVVALTHVGFCYQDGRGVQKNLNLAKSFFQEAAMLGDVIARRNFICLMDPSEYLSDQGMYLLEMAAEDDEVDIQILLSRTYLEVGNEYFASGIYWMYRAALNEDETALSFFQQCETDDEVNEMRKILASIYKHRHNTDVYPELSIWKNRKKSINSHAEIYQLLNQTLLNLESHERKNMPKTTPNSQPKPSFAEADIDKKINSISLDDTIPTPRITK